MLYRGGLRGCLCRLRLCLCLCLCSFTFSSGAKDAARLQEQAGFLSKAALTSADEVESLLKQAAEAEVSTLSSAKGEQSPLDHYPILDPKVGKLLEAILLAVRHLVAASIADNSVQLSASDLQEAAKLESQVTAILSGRSKEPVFWWHGPKWMVLDRYRGLFRTEVKEQLTLLAGEAASTSVESLVGQATEATTTSSLTKGEVPELALIVGDDNCGGTSGCDVASAVASLLKVRPGQKVHILVLHSQSATMKSIGSALKKVPPADSLYVTYEIAPSVVQQGPDGLVGAVNLAVRQLGVPKLNLVWLPYDSFKKKSWQATRAVLEKLSVKGKLSGYGAQAPVPNGVVAGKLLDRTPKPAAWLARHDLGSPASLEAVAAAHKLGIAAVALPSSVEKPLEVTRTYLATVAGADRWEQEALLVRHTMALGLRPSLRMPLEDVPQVAASLPPPLGPATMRQAELQLFDCIEAMLAHDAKAAEDPSASGVKALMLQARLKLAEPFAALPVPPSAEPASQVLEPGLSASTAKDIEEHAATYKKNDHIVYVENFFDEETWKAITDEVKRLWKSKDMDPNCNLDGHNRLGGYVLDHNHRNTSLYRLIYGNEQFRRWVTKVNGEGEMWPSDFPIELREYGPKSSGMMCHPDLQMYAVARKDVEFALTVDNDSKCKTTFYDANRQLHEIHTKANGLIMVRANAAEHCVSPTHGGKRTIIKFIFVGDYRKGDAFWHYTGNECNAHNSNRRLMEERREPGFDGKAKVHLLEL
mmetsp:Transcript_86535/g.181226  ORF Transcript_86535/g.181226 Transcript_86535/m.181226 type:complete len:759 (-) Transcript_86535:234-2510(-)|eukprot:CAMPEP_0206476622 /NCGR_PEP_ID=MMETSP0324_2-20121206/34841_1 /ASSEMBLY_ACC=CAM_ASM_000836 /TAXON_ID=2866 /ORGANISM="Crypthecodinium cohnii, Strain Seligo" /LENGTH=758 /DNA_ID=CAMNT_0053952319 /DNA_START=75 /DNA_END=2351 /DNA_ORIENTATION=-